MWPVSFVSLLILIIRKVGIFIQRFIPFPPWYKCLRTLLKSHVGSLLRTALPLASFPFHSHSSAIDSIFINTVIHGFVLVLTRVYALITVFAASSILKLPAIEDEAMQWVSFNFQASASLWHFYQLNLCSVFAAGDQSTPVRCPSPSIYVSILDSNTADFPPVISLTCPALRCTFTNFLSRVPGALIASGVVICL